MKKNILFKGILAIALSVLIFNGCKKDDTTQPVITVTGDNPATVVLGGTYTDAGATANDAEDGTVTVSHTSTVDATTAGTYTITYSASDKAGNTATATRTVNVVITRANYVWTGYSANDSCTTNATIGAFGYTGNIAASGLNADAIIISNFSGTNQTCIATVSGSTVTIASQTVGAFTNVTGNGTMNNRGNSIVINYTATMGTTESYHAVFTKQ